MEIFFSKNKSLYIYTVFLFIQFCFIFVSLLKECFCLRGSEEDEKYISQMALKCCFLLRTCSLLSLWTELASALKNGCFDIFRGGFWYTIVIRLVRVKLDILHYIAVQRCVHRIQIPVLKQSEASIGLNSLIPDLTSMLCVMITLIHKQFWLCIDSSPAYLPHLVFKKLFSQYS